MEQFYPPLRAHILSETKEESEKEAELENLDESEQESDEEEQLYKLFKRHSNDQPEKFDLEELREMVKKIVKDELRIRKKMQLKTNLIIHHLFQLPLLFLLFYQGKDLYL